MSSMKVSHDDKIRVLAEWPRTMDDFRARCDVEFAQKQLFDEPGLRMSELNRDPQRMSDFLSQS